MIGLRDAEWQQISLSEWVFGVKLRGLVRKHFATVTYGVRADPNFMKVEYTWFWKVPSKDVKGTACSLREAVRECEQSLGVE